MNAWTDADGYVYARLSSGELIGPYADRTELEQDTTETERAGMTIGSGWGG